MRRNIFLALIAPVVLVTTTYKIYDKESRLFEIWQDQGEGKVAIYGPRHEEKGFIIKKENSWERYDKEWNRESTIKIEGKEK